jgi:nucleoside-diphosphate-sugar epimerase
MVKSYLVTGGAGFIGSNYVSRLIQRGENVTIYDNLSRSGSKLNLEWLLREYGQSFNLIEADIRDYDAIADAALGKNVIVHLAAQHRSQTHAKTSRSMLWELSILWKLPASVEATLWCCTLPRIKCMGGWRK